MVRAFLMARGPRKRGPLRAVGLFVYPARFARRAGPSAPSRLILKIEHWAAVRFV